MRHGVTGEQHLQHLRDVLWGEAERAGALLIHFEADGFDLLAPVEVGVDDLAVLRHDGAHLIGDGAHPHRIGSHDAELDREADRRTKAETIDARPCLRQCAVGEIPLDARLDPLARRKILRHNDDLGEVGIGKDRVEPQPEARRALADICRVGDDVGIAGKQALGLPGCRVGGADGAAFGQSHLEEQLAAGRGREELLLDKSKSRDRGDEHRSRNGDDA